MKEGRERTSGISEVIEKRRSDLSVRQGYQSLLLRALALVCVGYALFTQVFLITQAGGMGMFPAIKDGDLAIVFRLERQYERNDVVTYRDRQDGARHFGRIAARQGDVVTIDEGGALVVNGTRQSGEILYPTYAKEGAQYPLRVPEGCVFVLGDYRTQTWDSRDIGPIPMENVEGKVIALLRRRGL